MNTRINKKQVARLAFLFSVRRDGRRTRIARQTRTKNLHFAPAERGRLPQGKLHALALFALCERRLMSRLPHQQRASRKTCFFVFCAVRWAQNPYREADQNRKFALYSCRARTFATRQTPCARLVRTMRAPFNVPSPAPYRVFIAKVMNTRYFFAHIGLLGAGILLFLLCRSGQTVDRYTLRTQQ